MTTLLKEAFDRASQLPEDLQNQLARDLLDEIEWELKWDNAFSESQDLLEELAQKAIRDFKAGKVFKVSSDSCIELTSAIANINIPDLAHLPLIL